LSILDTLEATTTNLRKQWVQLNKLDVVADLSRENRGDLVHQAEARRLISELEQSNPTIWADDRFGFHAFQALYGSDGWQGFDCWRRTLQRSGLRSASPAILE
jgi:hypothetical protein